MLTVRANGLFPGTSGAREHDPVERLEEQHWDSLWRNRAPDEMSWYEAHPATSLELIRSVSAPRSSVIDVGGGASRVVDELLAGGYEDVTVLDIAPHALELARRRLGGDASRVRWAEGDVLEYDFGRTFDVWHDRAVFHFLVDPRDRIQYVDALVDALAPGGHAIIATFGPQGPTTCSRLPVQRYDQDTLADAFGARFGLQRYLEEDHVTPAGVAQQFAYGVLERR